MEERRGAARWQINKRAELTVKDGLRPIPCLVEDISGRGMRIALTKDLFPEVFANFNLSLSEAFTFDAEARLAWSEKIYEKNIYGLAFERMEEPVREGITRYIKDNFPAEMAKQVWSGI